MFVELYANTSLHLYQYLWIRTCQEASAPTEIYGFKHTGLISDSSDLIQHDEKSQFNTQVETAHFICFMH